MTAALTPYEHRSDCQSSPARVVMETLGHSAIAVTMNTYSHVLPSLQRDAADRMNGLLA